MSDHLFNPNGGDGWILVLKWDELQHYKNRNPPWIKNYLNLLDKDEYMELSPGSRALLHGLWLLVARRAGDSPHSSFIDPPCFPADTLRLSRALSMKVSSHHIASLVHAGFIEVSASKPLASSLAKRGQNASLEREREKERERAKALSLAKSQKRDDPPAVRPRSTDELWDVLSEELGEVATDSERGRRNKALKELRQVGATPDDVRGRIAEYRSRWPNIDITAIGIVRNWTTLGRSPNGAAKTDAFKCETCGQSFVSTLDRKEHEREHKRERTTI